FHICDEDPVICHRHILVLRTAETILHLPLIEHASSAVDDKTVSSEFIRELCPRGGLKVQFLSGILSDPSRDFHSTDVITLSVVCTPLTDQDRISVFHAVQRRDASHRSFQISFVSGKENGK